MSRKIFPVFVFLFFLVSAAGFPTIPMNVYGTVTEDGNPVEDRRIEFRYNGSVIYNITTDSSGFYDAYIPYGNDYSGKTVRIFIGDTNPKNFTYDRGSVVKINMSGEYRPPDISEVEVPTVLNKSAIVTWETNEKSTSLVEFGDSQNDLERSINDSYTNLTKDHRLNLSELTENTKYYFRVISEDANGNKRIADNDGSLYTFKTKGGSSQKENKTKKKKQKKKQNQKGQGKLPSGNFGKKEVLASLSEGTASVTAVNVSGSLQVNLLPESDSQSLQSVSIDVSESLEEVQVDVESLESKPEAVPDPGQVYRYQSITTSASEEEISGATITFRVKKSWLEERNATLEEVVMKRYSDGWQKLETEYLDEEENFYRFEAQTPGFSFFAVALQQTQGGASIKFENISLEPQEGQAPLNVSITGQLVNTGLSEASKTVTLYLDGEELRNKTFEIGAGDRKNFSFNVVIEEPGVHTLEVGNRAFTVNAEDPSSSFLPVLAVLILVLISLGTVGYLQYSGIVDFESMLLENVGGEEERIEVEDGRFTFKAGDEEDEDSQEVEGHVDIELDLSREKPTVKEKRVYRQAGRDLEVGWAEKLRKEAGEHEEELSRRISEFAKEVKEQNSDGFVCSICMDEFDTEDGLHMHQALTHDVECEVCGEKFETVRGLHIHQGMTHDEISHDLFQN